MEGTRRGSNRQGLREIIKAERRSPKLQVGLAKSDRLASPADMATAGGETRPRTGSWTGTIVEAWSISSLRIDEGETNRRNQTIGR